MWATEPHEGITGVTFDSDGHRLVGTLYLAGANHAFSWHRTELAGLITGWLGAALDSEGVRA